MVPSTGSMIHVGLSVRMQACPFATDSSPMKLQQRDGEVEGRVGVRGQAQGRGSASPVRALSKLLLQGADDDPLHSLVRLGDQVHGRALGLDLNLALSGFPDFLNQWRADSNADLDHLLP